MFSGLVRDMTTAMTSLPESTSAAQPVHYPTSSSRLLLDLLRLSRCAQSGAVDDSAGDQFDGIVTRPVLRSLLAAVRLRDAVTMQHVRRTALVATGLARFLGWEGATLRKLEIAALLHDIGKIGVPDHVLFKPGALHSDEQDLMALHHQVGMDVLQACRVHQEVLEIIHQSNSHCGHDATTNTEPSQGARILAIADAYDSLSTKQAYRDAKSHDEILSIMMGAAGTQFDGNLVSVLNRWVQGQGLPFVRDLQEVPPLAANPGFFQLAEEMQASSFCHIFSCLHVLESLYDGFYLVDSDLRFRIWNHGMERLVGRPASRMLDQTWTSRQLEFADKQGCPLTEMSSPLREVIKTGAAATRELKVLQANDQWLSVEVVSVPLIDHDGSLQGVAEIFREISRDRRRRREDKDLHRQATRDSLTGVTNRGELERMLEEMLADFQRAPDAEPFSVIFLDVDHFKRVNDTYLHQTGDQVLVGLAKLLQSETYSGEIIGRYGGEEFVVVCPSTDIKLAATKAERLRRAISVAAFSKIPELKVTASFGVTEVEAGDTLDNLFLRADKALFTSKEKGRNRTTALSRSELLTGKTGSVVTADKSKESYVFENTFMACVTSDMIVLKFSSFVKEEQAKLVKIADQTAKVHLGRSWLLPFWGAREKRQPVELRISFGPPPQNLQYTTKQGATERTLFQVTIVPRGWPPDAQTFQARARLAFRTLKSHFAAD